MTHQESAANRRQSPSWLADYRGPEADRIKDSVTAGRGLNIRATGSVKAAGDALAANAVNLLRLSRIAGFDGVAELARETRTGVIEADRRGASSGHTERRSSHSEGEEFGHLVSPFVSPLVSPSRPST